MRIDSSNKWVLLLVLGILWAGGPLVIFAQQPPPPESQQRIEARSAYITGLAAFESENYQEALNLLKKAYDQLSDQAGVNFALADTYLHMDDLPNAAYYGKEAARLDPENRWYRLKLSEIYSKSGQNEATIRELKTALKYHPVDTNILFKLAQSYTQHNQQLEANTVYNRLIQLEGPSIAFYLQRLKNFDDLNMQDSAVVELQKIRDLNPDNLSILQELSNYYLKMNQLVEAKEVLQNALQLNQKSPKALMMLSEIYISQGKWDSVSVSLGRVVSDSSVSERNKITVAKYLVSQFRDDTKNTALQEATKSVLKNLAEAEPTSSRAQALAADFFMQTQQNLLALQALEKATDLNPTNDRAWRQRLQILLIEGRSEEAVSVGQKAAEKIPQDPFILFFLGNAYLANENHTEAIKYLKESAGLPVRKQFKANIVGSLGDAYAGLEKWEQAFDSYKESLALQSQNATVLNNYAYFLSLQKKNLEKAEEMAKKANELVPKNSSYLDTLGWVYFQKGNYKQAEKYIRASLDTGETSAEVLEHMGEVMNKLNQPEQASGWWRKALEKDSTRTHLKDKIQE